MSGAQRAAVAVAWIVLLLGGCEYGRADGGASELPTAEPPALQAPTHRLAGLPVTNDCNIETLNLRLLEGGKVVMDGFSDYLVEGWVIDAVGGGIGDPVRLHVIRVADGKEWQTVPALRLARPDVVDARGGWWKQAWVYADAGFQATIPRDVLVPGRYRLGIEYRARGNPRACGVGTEFEVIP